MSILSDYIALVNSTITNKTADFSITPQNVGNRLTELATIVPSLALPVPLGTIIMYAPASTAEFDATGLGVASNVIGWAICNGSNTTPDMRSRFVVGYNPGDVGYDAIGETGGQKYVTEVLTHSHFSYNGDGGVQPDITNLTYPNQRKDSSSFASYVIQGTAGVANLGLTSPTGVAQPDNRPPYFTVLYLKKIA
jgi:hypothetical protein